MLLKKNPNRILVISTRQIGDALLATPLIHSLKTAYPKAKLEVLVFKGTESILSGNPDIDGILAITRRPSFIEYLKLLRHVFRKYDLAVSTLTGDRPIFYAFLAAKTRISVVEPLRKRDQWKRRLLTATVDLDDEGTHTVEQNLKLAELLGINKQYQIICPYSPQAALILKQKLPFDIKQTAYVVLHLCPMWHYKRWTQQAWRELIDYLLAKNLKIVLTGGSASAELEYMDQILKPLSGEIYNLAGQLSFAEVAELITNAKFFLGPDTAVTHLAAATGKLSFALFGPTNPIKWAPWPKGYASAHSPFARVGSQHVANVMLIQGVAPCVPCHQEGCERHKLSYSRCLTELPAKSVIEIIEKLTS